MTATMRPFAIPFLLTAAALAITAVSTPTRADDIDDIVTADMAARHIPGLGLAIVQNGAVVKESAYGLADVDKKAGVFPATMFEIGPLTRQITATAVMQLVEMGKVGLDDKISKYIVNPPDGWSDITIRHLLTQTSGIKDADEVMPVYARITKALTVDQTIALVAHLPLAFTPGEQWQSSCSNYILLGKVIEKASGLSYGEYISTNILKPAGMDSTHLANPKAAWPAMAKGYTLLADGTPKPGLPSTATSLWAAGSIVANAGDLARWSVAMEGNKLVKADSAAQIVKTFQLTGDNASGTDCAFGLTIRHPQGHNIAENGGATGGFMSHYCRDLDTRLEIIILTNDATVDTMPLAHRILESYIPSIAPDPMAEKDPPVDEYCKGILKKLQDGQLDANEFSPDTWTTVRKLHLDAVGKVLSTLGPLTKFEQNDKDYSPDGQPIYSYRCIFGDTAYELKVGPSADGKIGHFEFAMDPFDVP